MRIIAEFEYMFDTILLQIEAFFPFGLRCRIDAASIQENKILRRVLWQFLH